MSEQSNIQSGSLHGISMPGLAAPRGAANSSSGPLPLCRRCMEYMHNDGACRGVAGQCGPSHSRPSCFVKLIRRSVDASLFGEGVLA